MEPTSWHRLPPPCAMQFCVPPAAPLEQPSCWQRLPPPAGTAAASVGFDGGSVPGETRAARTGDGSTKTDVVEYSIGPVTLPQLLDLRHRRYSSLSAPLLSAWNPNPFSLSRPQPLLTSLDSRSRTVRDAKLRAAAGCGLGAAVELAAPAAAMRHAELRAACDGGLGAAHLLAAPATQHPPSCARY